MQTLGNSQIVCCGKLLEPLKAKVADEAHQLVITEVDDELYLQWPHEMSKEHYLTFTAYVGFDRILTLRLYPEQDCAVRLPKVYSGKIVYHCNQHGLFEYKIQPRRTK